MRLLDKGIGFLWVPIACLCVGFLWASYGLRLRHPGNLVSDALPKRTEKWSQIDVPRHLFVQIRIKPFVWASYGPLLRGQRKQMFFVVPLFRSQRKHMFFVVPLLRKQRKQLCLSCRCLGTKENNCFLSCRCLGTKEKCFCGAVD